MKKSVLRSFASLATVLAISAAFAGGRIALLDLGLPSGATVFESELAADHEIVRVAGETLKSRLAAEKFDLLVLPFGPLYPGDAADAILSYLRSGGRLFTSGGYAFDAPAEKGEDGRWRRIPEPESGGTQSKFGRLDGVRAVDLPPLAAWSRAGYRDSITELAEVRLPDGSAGLEVSTGWCHGWAGGRATQDPSFASVNLDFTDSHCYMPAERVNEFVKPLDLRVFGKPFVIGEFGSKVHPSLVAANPWDNNDTEDGQCSRFREVAAQAFGNGVTLFEIWMWRDTGVLVWGINHEGTDGPVARKSVAVMADVARTFGSLPLAENPPDTVLVMDESLRWDGTTRDRTTARQGRVARALQKWGGANFSCVTSSMTNALPGSVKCVIDAARVESFPGKDAELAVRVGDMLRRSGAFFTRRDSDPPALDTWRVPGVGSHAWVFWNGGESRIAVERDGHRLELAPKRVGYLQVADDGSLVRSVEL